VVEGGGEGGGGVGGGYCVPGLPVLSGGASLRVPPPLPQALMTAQASAPSANRPMPRAIRAPVSPRAAMPCLPDTSVFHPHHGVNAECSAKITLNTQRTLVGLANLGTHPDNRPNHTTGRQT
jgi:hypothetical protein